jgi:hypothetical protein
MTETLVCRTSKGVDWKTKLQNANYTQQEPRHVLLIGNNRLIVNNGVGE